MCGTLEIPAIARFCESVFYVVSEVCCEPFFQVRFDFKVERAPAFLANAAFLSSEQVVSEEGVMSPDQALTGS